jgi:MFS family permease
VDVPGPEPRLSGDPLAGPPHAERLAGGRRRRWRAVLRRTRLDLAPLRTSRDFRLLFTGGAVSFLGSMVTYVALPYQMYTLTGSVFAVGLLGAVELVPMVVFGLYGGALADAVDRRRMALLAEWGLTLASATLLANALLPQPHVVPLYVVAAVVAALDGLQRPSLEALVPRLVNVDQLPAAGALASLRGNVGMVAGPALGGLLATTWGVAAAYTVDVVSFAASLTALSLMRPVPPTASVSRPGLRGIAEGLRYAASRQDLLGTYVVDLVAMLLAFPLALFPAVAATVLDAPWALGLLYSAGSLGSLLATLTSGWTAAVHRHGAAILLATALWGCAIAAFGLATDVRLAFLCLLVAGAADMVSGLFRSIMWNSTIPDELRGRLAGIELLSYSTGPLLGQLRAGGVASLWSIRGSIVSGGLLCVGAVAALAVVLPQMRRFDSRTNEHAVRERQRRAR